MTYTGPQAQTLAGDLSPTPQTPKNDTKGEGRTIGNYRLGKMLGQGGMGTVYEAQHVAIGKKVAIKLLLPQFSQRPDILERFFHEAKTVTDIHHENIVDILDFGQTSEGEAYIQMEYLEGKSLATALREKDEKGKFKVNFTPKRIAHIALQMCSALKAAHEKGVVHRDIKPDNVFLTERVGQSDFFVKVLDFGIAKLVNNEEQQQQERGIVIGTVLYMSPEQALGSGVDHQTDIYAIGALLFELACGAPPFFDQDAGKVRRMHITEKPPMPRSINPELPKKFEDVILKCLAKEKKDRYQDLLEVAADIGEAVGTDPKPYFFKASEHSNVSEFLGKWWLAIAGALLFVLGLGYVLSSGILSVILDEPDDARPVNIAPTPTLPEVTPPTPTKPTTGGLSILVKSEPPGAIIRDAAGADLGVAPTTINVPEKTIIEISPEGGKPCRFEISAKLIATLKDGTIVCKATSK
jgi:serine/threonine protein kinase